MTETIKILHISDLHFGAKGQQGVWESLEGYLNTTLMPDLILVTGDIIDSPKEDLYRAARQALDRLGSTYGRYFVCPGNHDRHPRGNALGWVTALYKRVARSKSASAWFDNQFGDRIPPLDRPDRIVLERTGNRWTVDIYGLDTSINARFSAQGIASLESLEKIESIAGASISEDFLDADLVVVLLHHHLLPIAALERSRQSAKGLFGATTTMLNAGTVLEALTHQSVNLVLHGHEHHKSAARYGSLLANQGTVTVIGAGSATGMHTREGCDCARASMNLIELLPDRTVLLREIRRLEDGWGIGENVLEIFDSRSIRQARAARRVEVKAPPTSQIVKTLEFTRDRNILVREARTTWACTEPNWPVLTVNGSGAPVAPRVVFTWEDGTQGQIEPPDGIFAFRPIEGQDDSHIFQGRVPKEVPALARRVNVEYLWLGGGVVTQRDLKQLDPTKRGPYRGSRQEFAALRIDSALAAFTLMVSIPPKFAPNPKSVSVYVELPGEAGGQGQGRYNRELSELVHHTGEGLFFLSLTYPLKGARYVLAWTPPETPAAAAATLRAREIARRDGDRLLAAFRGKQVGGALGDSYSVALYVPQTDDAATPVPLVRVAAGQSGTGIPGAPWALVLRDGRDYPTRAWWGQLALGCSEDATRLAPHELLAGFQPGEKILGVIPLRPPSVVPEEEPVGILRVGIASPENEAILAARLSLVAESLATGAMSVLQEVA